MTGTLEYSVTIVALALVASASSSKLLMEPDSTLLDNGIEGDNAHSGVTSPSDLHLPSKTWILSGLDVTASPDDVDADNATAPATDADMPFVYHFSQDFLFFSLAVIIPAGLLCNTVSLLVFMSCKLRKRAASWYLAALALSDDISLLCIIFDYWLKTSRIDLPIIKKSHVFCVVVTHASYASRLFSAWLVMSFTLERFIGVMFPLRRAVLSSTNHAKRVIATEGLACIVCTAFIPFTIGIVSQSYGTECDVLPQRWKIYMIFNVIFLVFGSIVIPIVVIFSLNMFILHKINQRKKHFVPKNMTFNLGKPEKTARAGREYNIASVLVVVSGAFVILNIPYCVCWFALFFGEVNWKIYAAKYITSVPYYLNYAINFALYSLCARAFRSELWHLIRCHLPSCGSQGKAKPGTDTRPSYLLPGAGDQHHNHGPPEQQCLEAQHCVVEQASEHSTRKSHSEGKSTTEC